MKIKENVYLAVLAALSFLLIVFSDSTHEGARQGLVIAEETIIPSLLPLLILFLLIMKTGAKNALARLFGKLAVRMFHLPMVTIPAIILGLVGGYPTGALLTQELYMNEEIDEEQAKRMLSFNFCGGCGFIITAVGTARLGSIRQGAVLFFSNVLSAIIIGIALSFKKAGKQEGFYSYQPAMSFSDALSASAESAVKSVLSITAYIILFSSFNSIVPMLPFVTPIFEITGGVCGEYSFPLELVSAYLAFGGLCIHLQLMPIVNRVGMHYFDFLLFRLIAAGLSFAVTKILLLFVPFEQSVFSNDSVALVKLSSVNIPLSLLMLVGSFALVLDLHSRRKIY